MKVDMMGSERALLGFLLCKIHQIDPDLFVVSSMFSSGTFDFVKVVHFIRSSLDNQIQTYGNIIVRLFL